MWIVERFARNLPLLVPPFGIPHIGGIQRAGDSAL